MREFGKCQEISNDPVKVFEERRSKITFENPEKKKIKKVDVHCLRLKGKSCDGLLIELEESNTEHFVELKGNKVFAAIEQLRNTIEQISVDRHNQTKHAYIICTKSPPKSNTTIQRKKIDFRKNYHSTLTVSTGHHIVNI